MLGETVGLVVGDLVGALEVGDTVGFGVVGDNDGDCTGDWVGENVRSSGITRVTVTGDSHPQKLKSSGNRADAIQLTAACVIWAGSTLALKEYVNWTVTPLRG